MIYSNAPDTQKSLPAQNTSLANKDLITLPCPSLPLQMNPILQAEHVVKIKHTSSHSSKFTKPYVIKRVTEMTRDELLLR